MHKPSKWMLKTGVSIVLLSLSSYTLASGIRLGLDSAADLGNQFAGGAALAGDASTNYYNPAAMTVLNKHQIVGSAIGVVPRIQFKGTVTSPGLGIPPFIPANPTSQYGTTTSTMKGVIPAIHYTLPINDKWYFGMTANTPFGLGLQYGKDSVLRYTTITAIDRSVNLAPSLAYRINEHWSVGAGPDFQYFSVYSYSKINTQFLTLNDADMKNFANGWGYGGHIGGLYEVNKKTRIGLAFHSQIVHHLSGKSIINLNNVNPFVAGLVPTSNTGDSFRVNITMPAFTTLSAYHELNDRWAVMGTAEFTQWNSFRTIHAFGAATPTGLTDGVQDQYYRNTWRLSAAGNYRANEKWLLRAGAGVDQIATQRPNRTAYIPDSQRLNVSVGTRYDINCQAALDLGYSHSFGQKAWLNHLDNNTGVTENGYTSTQADVIGVQLLWNMA